MKVFTILVAIIIVSISSIHKVLCCYEIGIGKEASFDGSVTIAYSNEFTGNNRLSVIPVESMPISSAITRGGCVIPELNTGRSHTYAYQRIAVDLQAPETSSEGGVNTANVGVTFGVYNYVPGFITDRDPWKTSNRGIGFALWDIILQQSSSASDAIDIVESLANSCGFTYNAAGSFMVGDPNDVWVVEVISGSHFAAAKIPPNKYLAQPNMLRIREIPFSSPSDLSNDFRTSNGLVQFAITLGLYEGTGPFDFALIFNEYNMQQPWAKKRLVALTSLLSPSKMTLETGVVNSITPIPEWGPLTPDALITTEKLRQVQRYHYEGTEYDSSNMYSLGSPHLVTSQPLCKATTTYTLIMSLRSDGSHFAIAPTCSCFSTATPFFVTDDASSVVNPIIWRGDLVSANGNAYRGITPIFDSYRRVQGVMDRKGTHALTYHDHIDTIAEQRDAYNTDLDEALLTWTHLTPGSAERKEYQQQTTNVFSARSQQLATDVYDAIKNT